ncbi:MAG TPA: hypothetical protein VGV90_14405 [Solirubrobacteraceae bacterium]|nr:hypothetical protein [Solirubrobacteraceae bacterium]
MAARDVARALAAGRVAIGAGLLVAPRLSLGVWIGREAAAGAVAAPARALGIREVVLGGLALHVVDRPAVAARMLRTLALCDAVDLLATLAARRSLPPQGRALVIAMAGAAAAGQLWAAAQLLAAPPQR